MSDSVVSSPSSPPSPSPSQSPSTPAPGTLTPRQLDARRSNSQKSTGPRTARGKSFSRLNATQHGHYARHYSDAFRETLLALKEDPDEYDRLRQRLLGELATQDDQHDAIRPALALALEELAQLHWELDRERRRLNRMRERRLRALDQELIRRRAEIKTDEYGPPSYCERGLVNGPRSANNYKVILGYLEELIDQLDHQDFTHYEHHITWLYNTGGEMPRVQTKISLDFKRLSGRYEGILPDPDAHTARELRARLVQEREKYQKEYEAFKPYWPRITEEERERARDLETLTEEFEDDLERLEWEASLKRQEHLRRGIDRKLRTVIAIQREARLQEAHAARMADRAGNTGVPPVTTAKPALAIRGARDGRATSSLSLGGEGRQTLLKRARAGTDPSGPRPSRSQPNSARVDAERRALRAGADPSGLRSGTTDGVAPRVGGQDARAPREFKNEGTNRRSGLESVKALVTNGSPQPRKRAGAPTGRASKAQASGLGPAMVHRVEP